MLKRMIGCEMQGEEADTKRSSMCHQLFQVADWVAASGDGSLSGRIFPAE